MARNDSLDESGGSRGLNQADVKTMQRDAAGVRGVPESSYPSPKNGGQGVDILSLDGMVGRHPIDKTALQWIEWSLNLGLS